MSIASIEKTFDDSHRVYHADVGLNEYVVLNMRRQPFPHLGNSLSPMYVAMSRVGRSILRSCSVTRTNMTDISQDCHFLSLKVSMFCCQPIIHVYPCFSHCRPFSTDGNKRLTHGEPEGRASAGCDCFQLGDALCNQVPFRNQCYHSQCHSHGTSRL